MCISSFVAEFALWSIGHASSMPPMNMLREPTYILILLSVESIFEVSFSTLVTYFTIKSSLDQSEIGNL